MVLAAHRLQNACPQAASIGSLITNAHMVQNTSGGGLDVKIAGSKLGDTGGVNGILANLDSLEGRDGRNSISRLFLKIFFMSRLSSEIVSRFGEDEHSNEGGGHNRLGEDEREWGDPGGL